MLDSASKGLVEGSDHKYEDRISDITRSSEIVQRLFAGATDLHRRARTIVRLLARAGCGSAADSGPRPSQTWPAVNQSDSRISAHTEPAIRTESDQESGRAQSRYDRSGGLRVLRANALVPSGFPTKMLRHQRSPRHSMRDRDSRDVPQRLAPINCVEEADWSPEPANCRWPTGARVQFTVSDLQGGSYAGAASHEPESRGHPGGGRGPRGDDYGCEGRVLPGDEWVGYDGRRERGDP